jgi:hypothetical protein
MWSWENFIKKNKINFMLIREFRVLTMAIRVEGFSNRGYKIRNIFA